MVTSTLGGGTTQFPTLPTHLSLAESDYRTQKTPNILLVDHTHTIHTWYIYLHWYHRNQLYKCRKNIPFVPWMLWDIYKSYTTITPPQKNTHTHTHGLQASTKNQTKHSTTSSSSCSIPLFFFRMKKSVSSLKSQTVSGSLFKQQKTPYLKQ